ncbi:MAG TPA: 50S ribosomal protein L11 methyltransferase [Steroidobacteraceae bacterium]|jgi:ribosomal protein L11 methyltransferase|nr:50S ribosomal protein L11 methyltransferase [Steroidobacteraceae bacterium]
MSFLQLVVDLAGPDLDRAEEACGRLGALSVTLADAGDAPVLEPAPGETPLWPAVRLRALFPGSVDGEAAAAALAGEIGVLRTAVGIERVEDRVWEREWLKDFRPMRFGRRLWVCPAGQRPDGRAEAVLALDPGLAFGTGTHPTTALCLEWLDAGIGGGERVLDYGCGSGILALAALRLGAAEAAAYDIDRQALVATRENAEKNGLAAALRIAESADAIEGAFDVVLANILSGPLVALAPELAARTRAGGRIALAGLLDRQAGEVAQAYRPWFDIGPAAEREGWTLLAGRRRPE